MELLYNTKFTSSWPASLIESQRCSPPRWPCFVSMHVLPRLKETTHIASPTAPRFSALSTPETARRLALPLRMGRGYIVRSTVLDLGPSYGESLLFALECSA